MENNLSKKETINFSISFENGQEKTEENKKLFANMLKKHIKDFLQSLEDQNDE